MRTPRLLSMPSLFVTTTAMPVPIMSGSVQTIFSFDQLSMAASSGFVFVSNWTLPAWLPNPEPRITSFAPVAAGHPRMWWSVESMASGPLQPSDPAASLFMDSITGTFSGRHLMPLRVSGKSMHVTPPLTFSV